MFAKLSEKYHVPNPLEEDRGESVNVQSPAVKPGRTGIGFGASTAHTPISSESEKAASLTAQKPPLSTSLFGSEHAPSQSPFGSSTPAPTQSPFGGFSSSSTPAPAPSVFGASTPSPFVGTTAPAPAFGTTSSPSTFGQPSAGALASPFGQPSSATAAPTPFGAAAMVRGKTARELLTEFYQSKNPTKLTEVDKLLNKYHGQEEKLFLNVAKKYNLDPSVFGLSATPTLSSSSGGFGKPSTLGGGPTFGSPQQSFGGASVGGFGAAATPAPGQGFGSTSSASAFGSQGFGALAQSQFGSPPPPTTPFGGTSSPFGAPRR